MTSRDERSWDGWWWFDDDDHPQDELEADRAHGTLTFDPGGGPQLRLVHASADGEIGAFGEPQSRRGAIHGVTVSGREMSVIDAYLVRWRGALGGARIEDYRAQTIVEGAHVSSLDDLTFDEARFKLRGLRDWLGAWWYGPVHGKAAVLLFFVLSGFVLTWSLPSEVRLGRFYLRRVARILIPPAGDWDDALLLRGRAA